MEELLLSDTFDSASFKVYSCGTYEIAETAFVKRYVATLAGQDIVLKQLLKNHKNLYCFLGDSLMKVDLGVAFKKDDTSMRWKKINDAINEMKDDGTLYKILKKYGCDNSNFEEVTDNE